MVSFIPPKGRTIRRFLKSEVGGLARRLEGDPTGRMYTLTGKHHFGMDALEDSKGNKPKSKVYCTVKMNKPQDSVLDWNEVQDSIETLLEHPCDRGSELDDKVLEMELREAWSVGEIPISVTVQSVPSAKSRAETGFKAADSKVTVHGILSVECDAETEYINKLDA